MGVLVEAIILDEGQPYLRLEEDEAFALLGLCMTSPTKLDAISETALKKLADYCVAVSGPPSPDDFTLNGTVLPEISTDEDEESSQPDGVAPCKP